MRCDDVGFSIVRALGVEVCSTQTHYVTMIALIAPLADVSIDGTVDIAALRAGHPDAISACYSAHASSLLALAYRLTASTEDAEDIVHDVFLGLPYALRNYEERGKFGAWLKRVTARTALMHQRRRRDRRERSHDVDQYAAATNTDHRAQQSSDRHRIFEALSRVSPTLRAVFVLKMIEGNSHAEIAALLGISVGTSEVRLSRAVAQMRRLLGART